VAIEWDLVAFLILSAFEIIGSILVVINKRLVRAAFWLAMTLVTIGVIYLLFLSEFVFLIQILVYAGAVPILFVFGIMLTRRKIMDEAGEPSGAVGEAPR
jgi:NADH:ubiquinone oxidoreductase subunit 6 (subunit J)